MKEKAKCDNAVATLIKKGKAVASTLESLLKFPEISHLFHLNPLLNVPKEGKFVGRTCLNASYNTASGSLNDGADLVDNDIKIPLFDNPRLSNVFDLFADCFISYTNRREFKEE